MFNMNTSLRLISGQGFMYSIRITGGVIQSDNYVYTLLEPVWQLIQAASR